MLCIFFGKLYKDARSDQDNIEKKIIASDEITKKSGEIVTSYSPKRKSTSPEYEANQLKEYTIAIKANNIPIKIPSNEAWTIKIGAWNINKSIKL